MATSSAEIENNTTPSVNNNESGNIGSSNIVTNSQIQRIFSLVLCVFTFVLQLIALIVICTDSKTIGYSFITGDFLVLHFQDVYAYRYMLSVIVIGMTYTLLRLGFLIYSMIIINKASPLLEFYGDKFMSYLLATGATAGFGVTKDMNALFDRLYNSQVYDEFCSKGYASAALILIAFLCTAALSVLSSLTLAKPT